jgi:hypothetical protein
MEPGYRIIRPEDVGQQRLTFAQISLWRAADWGVAEGEQAVREALGFAAACKVRSIRTVFHPLAYPLTGGNPGWTLAVLRRLAAAADLGIIIHDEGGKSRRRLSAAEANEYANSVKELSGLCHVSIENSFNELDASEKGMGQSIGLLKEL